MSRYVITAARKDLDEIWLYLSNNSYTVADKFVNEIVERFPTLA